MNLTALSDLLGGIPGPDAANARVMVMNAEGALQNIDEVQIPAIKAQVVRSKGSLL